MMSYRNFIELFGNPSDIVSESENFKTLELEYEFSSINLPKEENFRYFFNRIRAEDKCEIFFSIDDGEAIAITKDVDFTSDLENVKILFSGHEEGEIINLKINIYKENDRNNFYFYSRDCFFNYIQSFDTYGLASFFSSDFFDHNSKINIVIRDFVGTLSSDKITIATSYDPQIEEFEGREKRFNNIIANNHSSFFGKLKVLPEDFIFEGDGSLKQSVKEHIEKVAIVLVISAIFDITDLAGNVFYYKLNGYKSVSHTEKIEDISTKNLEDFYNIYQWIYVGGNIVDKIGLARNIISLHLKDNALLELKGNVFESLKSSFKIYEKQNIKQYIEVRNKMSDQLLDYSKRVVTITDNFASGFQKSALALVTFFSSLIVTKVLAAPKNNEDFILYSTLITGVFIVVTFLYMLVSRAELIQQEQRFKKSYEDFKKRYTDLLTAEDIERIVNNDEEHKADVTFIKSKLRWYTNLWIGILCAIVLATLIYYFGAKKVESDEQLHFARIFIQILHDFAV
ncbi:hypothetical protein [Chryseobacterium arthrosphaerae]|uniref:hypothetical protein n=1 Tax=Chryseobacterium arthrosphaerae TaxID=651561 RepID=UPI0031DE308F